MPNTAIVFDPRGVARDIPYDQLVDLVKKGAIPAVNFLAPDGKSHPVPANRVQEAIKNGGKIQPFEEQEVKHPGFWASLGSDLAGMAKGAVTTAGNAIEELHGNPFPLANQLANQAIAMQDNAQHRKDEGRTLPYRTIAPVGELVGANVRGMEDSADEGDTGGVLGHAAAVPAAMALTRGAGRAATEIRAAAPTLEDLGRITPKQTAQIVGGTGGAVTGHGAGLSAAGAYYGAKFGGKITEGILGKETANTSIADLANSWRASTGTAKGAYSGPWRDATRENVPYAGEEPPQQSVFPGAPLPDHPGTFPGAPNPEAPSAELLQAQSLAQGGKAPQAPGAALGSIPVPQRQGPPPLPEAFNAPYRGPVGSADNPAAVAPSETPEAQPSAPSLAKPNLAKKLDTLLNDATGGKPLQPNVPLKDQLTASSPEAKSSAPEGYTPLDSSAVKSFKYDPEAHELHVNTPGGSGYVYGEVTPEQAADFESGKYLGQGEGDSPSVGKAWKDIRDSSPQVGKMVNGQRVATKPPTSLQSSSPFDDLSDILQKSLESAKAGKNAATQTPKATSPAAAPVPAQPANGRTGPSAALYEPREPEFPIASGAPTNVTVPGTDHSIPAQYEVRELSDIHPYEGAAA